MSINISPGNAPPPKAFPLLSAEFISSVIINKLYTVGARKLKFSSNFGKAQYYLHLKKLK